MAARSKKVAERAGVDADALLATYARWFHRQPLAPAVARGLLVQVRGFVTRLSDAEHGPKALSDPQVGDRAVRDYKRHVKTVKRWGAGVGEPGIASWLASTTSTGPWRPPDPRSVGASGPGCPALPGGSGPADLPAIRRGDSIGAGPGHGHDLLLRWAPALGARRLGCGRCGNLGSSPELSDDRAGAPTNSVRRAGESMRSAPCRR